MSLAAGGRVVECDVVVVGAGSSGAVIASRLSAGGDRTVVLLEAGRDYSSRETPDGLASIGPLELMAPEYAETHMYPGLLASRSHVQPPALYRRGRGVGGSSAINGLFAVRPTVADLNEWADAGCPGWSFTDVLHHLKALETDLDFGALEFHGADGPIPICRPRTADNSALDEAFHGACIAAGHVYAPDHNAPGATGLSPYAYNARHGRRVSTNDAYLEPARNRPNLQIWGNALVDRVTWEAGRAVGVSAFTDGLELEVRASEIVLSAGAIHSPAVLLRSGIGPPAELRELGIDVRADLPVGLGLQDHPALAVLIQLNSSAPPAGRRHAAFCLRFDTGGGSEPDGGMISATATEDPEVGAVIGWVNRVDSTGRIRLHTVDPRVDPRVDFDMLASAEDVRRIRRVAEELASLTRTASFEEVGNNLGLLANSLETTLVPVGEAVSDPDFEALLLRAVFDVSHATSSCRMGDPDDQTTVVDPSGRVHGFENLRVADASILPWVPRANTHLSAVLVGEKIAADLLSELDG
ncbi:MAG TPA: GMC family oxidoreductase N-terminal domain-containing protein [Acidimicrobiales bacterium]|nr:GMC family oxidoreductase N-terminal domain-containing protein [Acidimicrobiales bacterium]